MSDHPDDNIQSEYEAKMNALAATIDDFFNGEAKGHDRKTAFVLLISPFGDTEGRVNYISNGERKDIVTMMKEIIARFEGWPEMRGTA